MKPLTLAGEWNRLKSLPDEELLGIFKELVEAPTVSHTSASQAGPTGSASSFWGFQLRPPWQHAEHANTPAAATLPVEEAGTGPQLLLKRLLDLPRTLREADVPTQAVPTKADEQSGKAVGSVETATQSVEAASSAPRMNSLNRAPDPQATLPSRLFDYAPGSGSRAEDRQEQGSQGLVQREPEAEAGGLDDDMDAQNDSRGSSRSPELGQAEPDKQGPAQQGNVQGVTLCHALYKCCPACCSYWL